MSFIILDRILTSPSCSVLSYPLPAASMPITTRATVVARAPPSPALLLLLAAALSAPASAFALISPAAHTASSSAPSRVLANPGPLFRSWGEGNLNFFLGELRGGSSLGMAADSADDSDAVDAEIVDEEDRSDQAGGKANGASGDEDSAAVVAEVVAGPWEAAAASASMTMPPEDDGPAAQQRQSSFLCSILHSSLVLDCIFNARKRATLFPSAPVAQIAAVATEAQEVVVAAASTTTAATATAVATAGAGGIMGALKGPAAVPTAALAGGYALAAGVAFLLSRVPSPASTSREDEKFLHRSRSRLNLGLAAFGTLNLLATAGPGLYLGMSGAVINAHNAMVAVNGWMKGRGGASSSPAAARMGPAGTGAQLGFRSATSAALLVAAIGFLSRAVVTAGSVAGALAGTSTSLPVARVARLVLAGTVSLVLRDAYAGSHLPAARTGLAIGLGGLSSACAAAVAVPMMLAGGPGFADAVRLLLLSAIVGGNSLWAAVRS